MTNFIYNMQDELFHLNMILPVGEFSPIMKLVDHIEAQGKQLRDLNKTIEKKNKTIENYEREKKSLRNANNCLFEKVQKYEALLHSSEQAISALQKKCQEYKHSEDNATISTIETLVKENKELKEKIERIERGNLDLGDAINWYLEQFTKIKEDLEKEKHVNKDLNVIINSKNKLLDEYIKENTELKAKFVRIGDLSGAINKIIKE